MFEVFAAFFIALFVLCGIAAVIGHVLLFAALLQPRAPEAEQREPTRLPQRTPERVHWRRAA